MDLYLLKKLYELFEIPVYVEQDGKAVVSLPEEKQKFSPFFCDPNFAEELVLFAESRNTPFLYLEDEKIYYGIFCDVQKNVYFFGPLARKTMKYKEIKEYLFRHQVRVERKIMKCDLGIISKILVIMYYFCTGSQMEHESITIETRSTLESRWNPEEDLEHYQLEQSEEGKSHNSIEYETYLLQVIRTGDIEAMKRLMNEETLDMDQVGTIAVDSKKQTEYLMVSLITMAARAAIDGGVNPEQAYAISDVFLRQLEKCKNAAEMTLVGAKAQIDFTELVRKAKIMRSRVICVEECKDYIGKHLRKPFQVGEIAPTIGVSRTYLARKFSEVEGITIQQYIVQERCKHAANLLKYSNYPISIISEYFCFSSQSHFGVHFKKLYGVTPHEFRNQNRYIESK